MSDRKDLRVLVVEDSITIRKHIAEVLTASGMEVIGEAGDGKTAIELCERHRPDVMTLDMMLPIMTGVAATEYIMAYYPTPILIVSASLNRGELFRTYDALAAGAVDVLEKSLGLEPDGEWERQLVASVRMVARIRVISHPRARLRHLGRDTVPSTAAASGAVAHTARALSESSSLRAIAIGASTGGPSALLRILRDLPKTFPLPILLVLHISEPFGRAIAEWLDAQIALPVRYPRHGEPLPEVGRGVVLMAPPDQHLVLDGGRLLLTHTEERHSCRPSVDVLFESLAREMGARTLACLLTGMGRDGAGGLLDIRQRGGVTVAQDEASSIVFGMPGEAIRIGGATHVLPLIEIGGALMRATRTIAPTRGTT